MELKVSPEKPGFSSSDLASDPEDKAISEGEDDDDDRNHKHRRREALSQSLGGEQGLTRPYRKRNRPFENGYPYREVDTQSGETWNNYNTASDRDFPARFEKRHSNQTSFSRAPLEYNPRIRGNQTLSGEVGIVRGRGREPIPWGIHDSRLGLVDVASHMVQHGPVPPALFAGRGLSNVSNAQSTSWNAFGLVPGIPNGGFDSLHPLGMQGALRPAISPPMNLGIPRQRCRDFEERGFCLRGDMCPMEHGVNRIVIEDVQSLSQFNLPVSVSGQGALPVNSQAFHANSSRLGMTEDGFGLGGGSMVGASDVYDPDQPLWGNDNRETSAAIRALNQSNAHETESFLDIDLPDQQNITPIEGFNDERPLRNATNIGAQSSSVWGRIGSSKRSLGVPEKNDSVGTSSYVERDSKSEKELNTGVADVPHQGKWTNVDGNGPLINSSSMKKHSDPVRTIRKPPHQAVRTVFVNGIPLKDNKRETLLSHFQKFGQVIDIYIPAQSERAFVQFSKREEAEAALKAPDAVMGNRFIKLWWANRDNIPDDGKSGTTNLPITPRGLAFNPATSHPFALDKGKGSLHPASGKDGNTPPSVSQQRVYDHSKPVVANGSKGPPVQQKKLENLELLKEELRKKQEMLDQKRNEFRRQLDKLEKQAVGSKDVTASDPTAKKLKGETPPNHAKAESPKSLPRDKIKDENAITAVHTSNSNPTMNVQEPMKPSLHPQTPLGQPVAVNRFKLDNRPTAFRIIPPLPAGLANVAALKEHFSTYGDLSSVELEESELQETNDASVSSDASSARVCFATRRFAEKAFLHGKSWQGHKLQFKWLTSNNEGARPVNVSAASKISSDATNVNRSGEDASIDHKKNSSLGTGEPEHLTVEADADSVEQDIDSKSISTSFSAETQLS